MEKHIDIILSNPPYKMGNEITRAIVDNVDFDVFINLMPCSYYKAKNLFKDVKYIESADDDFVDATVGGTLTIAVMEKEALEYNSFEELMNYRRDAQLQEYYKLNTSVKNGAVAQFVWCKESGKTEEEILNNLSQLNIEKDFCITLRTAVDGVHELGGKGAFDIDWNVYKNKNFRDIHYSWDTSANLYRTSTVYLHLNSSIEKQNLCRFWYTGKSGLMHKLIKGLQASTSIALAIPRINWSISNRDYEHATLEDVMNWLREDNNL